MLGEDRKNRIKELESRSFERGMFTFSDFLSPTSLFEATEMLKKGCFTVFGGVEYAERKMIRFGNSQDLGYEEEFPITILKITLVGGKFASPVTHRDVLGAIMGLGIERQKVGDIFVSGNFAYVISHETVAKLILLSLDSVGRNKVSVEEIDALPLDLAPKTTNQRFSVSSNRADAIICKVFNLPREDGKQLFLKQLVFINGKPIDNSSKPIREGETVTVRGYGKFAFIKEDGQSKKGKQYVEIEQFV